MSKQSISVFFDKRPRLAFFVERPNRFLVRCPLTPPHQEYSGQTGPGNSLEGPLVEAHLPDPGRLRELLLPGRSLWLTPALTPARKTKWSVVLCETPEGA